jgi:SAM-dependent methyltransferase
MIRSLIVSGTSVAPGRRVSLCARGGKLMNTITAPLIGNTLKTQRMPGHWVLARLGKRVLRPGGIQLTRRMLDALTIRNTDDVVEFAPGLGVTAQLTLALTPSSYTAVERDATAAKIVSSYLKGERQRCVLGSATNTGLASGCADVVYGEAMLTMQTPELKREIVREAHRLLRKGGRYGIHEMCLKGDGLDTIDKHETERALTGVVHHGVRPLTISEWRSLLASEGFAVHSVELAPMSLLEPGRIIKDEGFFGALRFIKNLVRDSEARRRVLEMRSVFRRHRQQIGAVSIIARKV